MTDDIVARLRRNATVPLGKIERKAAFDAAKRIVKDRKADILARLRAIITVSGGVTNSNVDHIVKAADEIERLRAERDEARRLFCELDAEMYGLFGDKERLVVNRASYLPSDAARKRKWDCFREAADA